MRCQGTNERGEACGSPENFVDPDTGFCPYHAPGGDEHQLKNARKGAEATAKKLRRPPASDRDTLPAPETIEDAKKWLAWTAENLATGMISDKEARALGYVLRSFVDTVERADVADELEELREKLQALQEGKLESLEGVA
jgi:hypothetical protein